jgi:hypothetical protein
MWYDVNKTLTHGCLFNMIIGNRGCGKTYGLLKKAIQRYLKNGSQFIYLRRYQTELDKVKETIFNALISNGEFEGHTIEYKADQYFIDGQLFGYAMALTTSNSWKSASFPLVNLIIFDECLVDEGGTAAGYLKNEVRKFLDFYETIARMRENVIVFLLSNAISFINPYTLYWNLQLPYGSTVTQKDDLILLQLVMNVDFIAAKKKTRFGRLIDGTTYGDYAINNKFLKDNKDFIEKKSGSCEYIFTIKYNDNYFGVWKNYHEGKMYVSCDVDNSCKFIYSLTLDDHTPNTMLLNTINKSIYFKNFIDMYKLGCVYFENQKVKNISYDVIKMCIGG